jgi:hypothetical protein
MARARGARWRVTSWHGDDIKRDVERASIRGVDQTMAKCVTSAKGRVRVKTATLQGSLRFQPAVSFGVGVRGTWGSFDVNYALWQEIGTAVMSAQPYLRPAADAEYPQLKRRIQANL